MRQPRPMLVPDRDRIATLEEGRKNDGERLDKIETKVDEMHDILVGVRTIGRFLRNTITWFGGPTVVMGGALYGWKLLSGH